MTIQYYMIYYGNNKKTKYGSQNKLSKMFNRLSAAKTLATVKNERERAISKYLILGPYFL